jgi:hypothetical protein
MPLQDLDWNGNLFAAQSPLRQWVTAICDSLNAQLSGTGGRFTAEVLCLTRSGTRAATGTATAAHEHTYTAAARFIDQLRVNIHDHLAGTPQLATTVFFVLPDHKAESDAALALAVQAASLLGQGTGVVIVDMSPGAASWATHLHSLAPVFPIVRRPRNGEAPILAITPHAHNENAEQFAVWHQLVAPSAAMPTVPVSVRGTVQLHLDLEATYNEAQSRLA